MTDDRQYTEAEAELARHIHAALQGENLCVLMSRIFDPEYPEETIDGAYDLIGVARRLFDAVPCLKECLVCDTGDVAKSGIEGH